MSIKVSPIQVAFHRHHCERSEAIQRRVTVGGSYPAYAGFIAIWVAVKRDRR